MSTVDLITPKEHTSESFLKIVEILGRTQGAISLGFRRRGKGRKHGKVEVKRKWWGFSSASLFLAWQRETVAQGGNRGINHPMRRTQGAGIVKGRKS